MPDITMCDNDSCPLAAECYRNQAEPSSWQSWGSFKPTLQEGKTECDHFMPIYKTPPTDTKEDSKR